MVKEQPGRPRLRPVLELGHEPAAVAGHRRRPGAAPGRRLDAPGRRRGRISRRRTTGRRSVSTSTARQVSSLGDRGHDPDLRLAAQDRRERDLGRVVHGPDRRGAGLPPCAERGRDPGGHDDADHLSGRDASERAGHALRDRRSRAGVPDVGRRDRQHRRRPLQRPSLDDARASRRATANRIAQPTGTSYTNTGLAPGTYYYKVTAEDAAGNVGPASNEANGTAAADTTPPTAPTNLTATGGAGQVALGWTASTDTAGIARYNVHRSTVAGFTPSAANRIAQPTGTSYTDTGLAAGTYYYRVIAEDPSGNLEHALERGDCDRERRATERARRRVQHGSGLRHLAPRPLRQRATTARSAARRGRRPAGSGARSASTARAASSPSPTRARSTSRRR